jgi:3-hydroxyacyl-[acyl-carrier-protein] dehydratase
VESWCQAAGVLVAFDEPNPDVLTGRLTLFGAVGEVRFHALVRPGDVVRHRVRPLKMLSDAAVFEGHAFVGGRPVMTVGQLVTALRSGTTRWPCTATTTGTSSWTPTSTAPTTRAARPSSP